MGVWAVSIRHPRKIAAVIIAVLAVVAAVVARNNPQAAYAMAGPLAFAAILLAMNTLLVWARDRRDRP